MLVSGEMSYDNVVGGKLKLKGKALDVKSGGVKKKRKKDNLCLQQVPIVNDDDTLSAADVEGTETFPQAAGDGEHTGEDGVRQPLEDHRHSL